MDSKIRLMLQQALKKVNKVYCMANVFEITCNAWLSEKISRIIQSSFAFENFAVYRCKLFWAFAVLKVVQRIFTFDFREHNLHENSPIINLSTFFEPLKDFQIH